jgi:hypothetical protein
MTAHWERDIGAGSVIGVDLGEGDRTVITIVAEAWLCEEHDAYHFNASTEIIEKLQKALLALNVELRIKPMARVGDFLRGPDGAAPSEAQICAAHKLSSTLRAVCALMNMPYHEGASFIEPLEKLVASYVDLLTNSGPVGEKQLFEAGRVFLGPKKK